MPTYFFNVMNVAPGPDQVGEVLENDEAAWKEATVTANAILSDLDGKFRPGQEWSLQVTDDAGKPLYDINIGSRLLK